MSYIKMLIEVALPLDAINKASAREKPIRHGHPGTLYLHRRGGSLVALGERFGGFAMGWHD